MYLKMNTRKNQIRTNIIENFREFCLNTSLHGLKYVGTRELSIIERLFFGISFVIALFISVIYTNKIYNKWNNTPVIIGINPRPTFINEIPFPAVTICNMNQARLSKVKNLNPISAEYSMLQTLCNQDHLVEEFVPTRDYRKYEAFILNVSQPCQDMLISCEFGSMKENCMEVFQDIITDEGLCCTFNSIDKKFLYKKYSKLKVVDKPEFGKKYNPVSWSPEKGYPKRLPKNFYPRTAPGVGSRMGFSVILNAQLDEYYCSSTNGAGFKVLLHNPAEAPNIGSLGISLKVGHETRTTITPNMNVASEKLKSLNKKYRKCIFAHESHLSIYATYSRRNCEMECEANLLAIECDCLHYYMPRTSPNINVCSLSDQECVENVTIKAKRLIHNDTTDCNRQCYAACFDLTYTTDSYSLQIGHGNYIIRDKELYNISKDFIRKNIAVTHFYYSQKAFRSNNKDEYIGFTDFLSNTGGLVSLFLGFSFVSLIEILYYLTLHPICEHRKYLKMKRNYQKTKHQFKQSTINQKRTNYHYRPDSNHYDVNFNRNQFSQKFYGNSKYQNDDKINYRRSYNKPKIFYIPNRTYENDLPYLD